MKSRQKHTFSTLRPSFAYGLSTILLITFKPNEHLHEVDTEARHIADTSVEDIEFILHLPALKELWLCDSVKDMEPIYSAKQIKRLYVSVDLSTQMQLMIYC